jgi:hypothetical protein
LRAISAFQTSSYLIVDPDRRMVIHHARGVGDAIVTRIANQGRVRFDPPGIDVAVAELFEAA